ncbi:M23 family metallopeptidase [Hyphobacterium marinum]|uniref:M23 family metallopeptidase n=1 Tax=Hyphobacterium marinum TaxID=3116574 RepID=A0ABU7LXH9_9PROT|nr:M23 family metallopeptidase [Hyphobacterium sp. Y6023]MEE2566264.1 M23 family metallopeptidase [Hyphobacterium sp. Y6023]
MGLSILLAAMFAIQGAEPAPIDAVVLHPFTPQKYTCSEHFEGELPYPGDALGADCAVVGDNGTRRDGASSNADYYSWRQPVLAPFDGEVVATNTNPVTNEPGTLGSPPASFIILRRADGVMVMIGHVREVVVSEGDEVEAGQYMARIGNNGMSTSPHIHIGAWRDETPLQIRWDLRAMGEMRREGWDWPEGVEP